MSKAKALNLTKLAGVASCYIGIGVRAPSDLAAVNFLPEKITQCPNA